MPKIRHENKITGLLLNIVAVAASQYIVVGGFNSQSLAILTIYSLISTYLVYFRINIKK